MSRKLEENQRKNGKKNRKNENHRKSLDEEK